MCHWDGLVGLDSDSESHHELGHPTVEPWEDGVRLAGKGW